jgi:acetyl/propionyl-CoA carboxylase alpha subunit
LIRKLLIANRGEIACRIIRTCREMGIATVAIFSDVDAGARHVREADEAVHIGAAPAHESYLNSERIIAAAVRTGADAIHPGYGFLAENAGFARAAAAAGLVFVGPPANVIEQMGSKIEAKRVAVRAGVPVVPGYDGDDQSDARFMAEAARIGFPVMVKASAGGGGKGMREVVSAELLEPALAAARREAKAAFGDATLMLEKRIRRPRHVEIQIFGDSHGGLITLGERECSIQRRHQKVIEESPSPALDDALRQRMCAAALALGKAIGYVNAGTVEFILDADKQFYFLEVNTRLQVEHPVTEMVRGIDLVRLQIEVAEDGFVPPQHDAPYGHAVEARIYAEDPAQDFLPSIGTIIDWNGDALARSPNHSRFWNWAGILVDAGVDRGDAISPHYDPTVAKVIAFGETRAEAIRRLDQTLAQLCLLGVRHNISYLRRVINHPEFTAGDIDTGFIDRHPELLPEAPAPPLVWIAAALAKELRTQESASTTGFRNNPYRPSRHALALGEDEQIVHVARDGASGYTVTIGDTSHPVRVVSYENGELVLVIAGHRQRAAVREGADQVWWVGSAAGTFALRWRDPLRVEASAAASEGSLRAPMPGSVIAVQVVLGQAVAAGDVLLIMEAMKMEHRIKAPYAGIVAALHYTAGQFAPAGAILLELHPT